MTGRIILIGGGEHARVVADALRAAGRWGEVAGYVDRGPVEEMERRFGLGYLGNDESCDWTGSHPILCFGGTQGGAARAATVQRLGARVAGWAVVVHPAAVVSASARLGPGSLVCAGAIVNTGAVVGAHAIINTGAVVEHDVLLGANVQVSPRAVLGGGVRVGADCYVGLGAVVRDHLTVGDGSVIGMGAVVTKDVPAGVLAVGHPARHRTFDDRTG